VRDDAQTTTSRTHVQPNYLLQVPAGTHELAASALTQDAPGCQVTYSDDSALLVEGKLDVSALPYVTTTHRVLARVSGRDIERALARLIDRLDPRDIRRAPRGFRIMFSEEGRLVSVSPQSRRRAEKALSSASGGRLTPRGGGNEFWVLTRRDMPFVILTEKLSASGKAAAGSLSTPLAHLLVAASHPAPSDRFWDPFCGSASIGWARATRPATSILCSDVDVAAACGVSPSKGLRARVTIRAGDFFDLAPTMTGTIDSVVTDPPWGEHAEEGTISADFTSRLADGLVDALAPHGRAAVLVSRRSHEAVTDGLDSAGLHVGAQHHMLVNGHPASLLVATRR
jgi:Putative RNA methylase family UPF0020